MIRENKKTLILGSLVILLPIPLQLLLGRSWSISLAAPLGLLAAYWVCVLATLLDPKQTGQGKKPLRLVLWILPALSLVLCGFDYLMWKQQSFPISTVFLLLFGVMFMFIGNYLPKVRQNYTIGIKIAWVYTSEENWNATHRFGGKVWFLGGLVMALSAFLPLQWSIPIMIVSILVLVLLPIAYSYRFYRRQKARGDQLSPIPKLASSKLGKYSGVFLVAILIFVACTLFTGNITYRFEADSFTIEASYYDDLTVSYEDIEDLSYQESNYPGSRVWGFGSLRLLMGTFQTENLQYTRYTYYRPDSAITMTVNGKLLVISGENPEQTKAIYDTLLGKVNP